MQHKHFDAGVHRSYMHEKELRAMRRACKLSHQSITDLISDSSIFADKKSFLQFTPLQHYKFQKNYTKAAHVLRKAAMNLKLFQTSGGTSVSKLDSPDYYILLNLLFATELTIVSIILSKIPKDLLLLASKIPLIIVMLAKERPHIKSIKSAIKMIQQFAKYCLIQIATNQSLEPDVVMSMAIVGKTNTKLCKTWAIAKCWEGKSPLLLNKLKTFVPHNWIRVEHVSKKISY